MEERVGSAESLGMRTGGGACSNRFILFDGMEKDYCIARWPVVL